MLRSWLFHCGTYTRLLPHVRGAATGIETFELDADTGRMLQRDPGPELSNPSFLCPSPDGKVLFAVEETDDHDTERSGSVCALRWNTASGRLEKRDCASSCGAGPVYLSTDRSGRYLLVANYSGGTVAVRRVHTDKFGEVSCVHKHGGAGANPERQEAPHPHCFVTSPCNRFAYVADLGLDRVVAYEFDETTGRAHPRPDLDVATPEGSGPRHLAFDAEGQYAYLVLELSSELASFRFDDGRLVACDRIALLPRGFAGSNLAAEVRVGTRAVYASNRGHDSIAVLSRDARGALTLEQRVASLGRTPRNFALSPDERFVVVAHQDSEDLVSFRVDAAGHLAPTGHSARASTPAYVSFSGARS